MSYIQKSDRLPCGHRGVYWRRANGGGALPFADGGVSLHCCQCGAERWLVEPWVAHPAVTEIDDGARPWLKP